MIDGVIRLERDVSGVRDRRNLVERCRVALLVSLVRRMRSPHAAVADEDCGRQHCDLDDRFAHGARSTAIVFCRSICAGEATRNRVSDGGGQTLSVPHALEWTGTMRNPRFEIPPASLDWRETTTPRSAVSP